MMPNYGWEIKKKKLYIEQFKKSENFSVIAAMN